MSDHYGPVPGPETPVYSTRFKIVAAVVLAVAAGLAVVAYQLADDSSHKRAVESGGMPDAIEAVFPSQDSQAIRQSTVGVDLVDGWLATLEVADTPIPGGPEPARNELVRDPVTDQVSFTPGPGKVLESLPLGRTCAKATIWDPREGRDSSERKVSWCFEVT